MREQRPLALMLGSAAHDRLHAGLSLAAASAALGRSVAIYLHADAVRLLDPGLNWAEDVRFAAVGSPAIAELLASAMELGVRITACQTGLALTGLPADALPEGVEPGGLVDFLGQARDAEIALG